MELLNYVNFIKIYALRYVIRTFTSINAISQRKRRGKHETKRSLSGITEQFQYMFNVFLEVYP